MSGILERAKAHYASLPRLDIKVPEWGEPGNPAVITWSKLTVNDQERIYAPVDGKAASGGLVRLRAVILKACDATGKPMFDGMDEHDLRYLVDGDIVGRIANAILFSAGVVDKSGGAVGAGEQIDDAKNV